jgi:sulfur-carrier protein
MDSTPTAALAPPEVLILLPRALLDLFPEAVPEVTLAAGSIGEAIAALDARWPGMRDRLCDSTPRIRRHLNIFVEGRRATLETQLKPGTKIYVMTAVSGG